MPTADALMGLGMPAQQAEQIGGNPSAAGAGVGTAQVGAKKLLSKNVEVTPIGGSTAYVMQNTLFSNIQVFNSAATAVTALIFPPVGHTLNGSLNASLSVPQNKGAILWQYKPTFWASIVAA